MVRFTRCVQWPVPQQLCFSGSAVLYLKAIVRYSLFPKAFRKVVLYKEPIGLHYCFFRITERQRQEQELVDLIKNSEEVKVSSECFSMHLLTLYCWCLPNVLRLRDSAVTGTSIVTSGSVFSITISDLPSCLVINLPLGKFNILPKNPDELYEMSFECLYRYISVMVHHIK